MIKWLHRLANRVPTSPVRHVITIRENTADCSCGDWHAAFVVRGPLPMWARAHLHEVKGTEVDDAGVIPR